MRLKPRCSRPASPPRPHQPPVLREVPERAPRITLLLAQAREVEVRLRERRVELDRALVGRRGFLGAALVLERYAQVVVSQRAGRLRVDRATVLDLRVV